MLKKRIIPLLLLNNSSLVKSVQYSNHRIVGDAFSMAKVFSNRMSDEMLIVDINATKNQSINYDLFKKICLNCNMPLSLGGGIDDLDKAQKLFESGADKIIVNSSFFKNPNLILSLSQKYGNQSIVFSLDAFKDKNNDYYVFSNSGKVNQNIRIQDIFEKINNVGIGEIVVNSINNDGKMSGFDYDLLRIVRNKTSLPIIISGGCGSKEDCLAAFEYGADAVALGSIFYWLGESIISIKEFLHKNNINVRYN
ncbi:HisA/HisF-related TIM barrel protein [Alphaproteobacteria bacterium]|nr:HisA/HisF-related TIM barrel protein [Alphaproteobacteria bacterium]